MILSRSGNGFGPWPRNASKQYSDDSKNHICLGFQACMYVCLKPSSETCMHVCLKHTYIHAWKPKHIWFLESSEYCFEAFLGPGPKPLPERLRIMAREPFFGLERISGFWSRQITVLKHIWALAENHCQNRLESWRASHFLVWSEYFVFGVVRIRFEVRAW